MKDFYLLRGAIDDLRHLFPTTFLSNEELNRRLAEYDNGKFSYFCIDLQGNIIKNAKCYLRGNQCNILPVHDNNQTESDHEWGEYSFSIVNSSIKKNPHERKVAYRLKPMPLDTGRQFVLNIFKSQNVEYRFAQYDFIADLIIRETKTKRYPIGGVGFTFDAIKNRIHEIKLYYTLMHFKDGSSDFCDNEGGIREKSFAKVLEHLQTKKMIDNTVEQVAKFMTLNNIPISLLGYNDQIENGTSTIKLYYRNGADTIPEQVLRGSYLTLFGNSFDTKLIDMHEILITNGLSLGEICLVQNTGKNSTLKICYTA